MVIRTKVVIIYFIVILFMVGLCWRIYRSASEIDQTYVSFTGKDLQTLDYLFLIRANLSKQEHLLFEDYAKTARLPMLVQLDHLRETLDKSLTYLQERFISDRHFQLLEKAYAGFTEELDRLEVILEEPATDWHTARVSLARLSNHSREAAAVLEKLFQVVSTRSGQTQDSVNSQLKQLTTLIMVFVIVVFAVAVTVGMIIRNMVGKNSARKRLVHFPERNPEPVLSLTMDGEVTYRNPACDRLAAKIDENLHSILPPDIKDRIHSLHTSGKLSQRYEYKLCDHVLSVMLQLLPDLDLCHIYISDVTEQRNAEKELHFQAFYDPITELPNRHSFLCDCKKCIKEQDFAFSVSTIAFLRFGLVARNLGLTSVDELLNQLVATLRSVVASSTLNIHTAKLYRFSCVSYTILLRANDDAELRKVTDRMADLLLLELSQPFHVRRREFWLRPIIGASFCPDDAVTAAALYGNASAAQAHLAVENRHGYQALTP